LQSARKAYQIQVARAADFAQIQLDQLAQLDANHVHGCPRAEAVDQLVRQVGGQEFHAEDGHRNLDEAGGQRDCLNLASNKKMMGKRKEICVDVTHLNQFAVLHLQPWNQSAHVGQGGEVAAPQGGIVQQPDLGLEEFLVQLAVDVPTRDAGHQGEDGERADGDVLGRAEQHVEEDGEEGGVQAVHRVQARQNGIGNALEGEMCALSSA
jgi:hypothetical protein